jgi:hypothetical protein
MLALLSMTSIAAAELALAAVRAIKRRSVRDSRLLSHLVLAVGAGTIGFALLEPVNNVLLGLGSLLLAATIIGQAFHRQEAAES